MKKEKYFCDLCGKEVPYRNHLIRLYLEYLPSNLSVVLHGFSNLFRIYFYGKNIKKNHIEICKQCAKELHKTIDDFLKRKIKEKKEIKNERSNPQPLETDLASWV